MLSSFVEKRNNESKFDQFDRSLRCEKVKQIGSGV